MSHRTNAEIEREQILEILRATPYRRIGATLSTLALKIGVSDTTCRKRLLDLLDAGRLRREKGQKAGCGFGSSPDIWRVVE